MRSDIAGEPGARIGFNGSVMDLIDSEFRNWAVVSYNDDTGLGRMAEDARAVLGIGHQLVIPSRRMKTKPLRDGDFLLTGENAASDLMAFLAERDGILVLEKADWTDELLPVARQLGLTIAAVPMWEWFRAEDPSWQFCDLFICPNRKCYEVVRAFGYDNAVQLPWPLNLARLPHRRVTGPAQTFIHNGGLMDHDDRKGTRDAIRAFGRRANRETRLIVRLQAAAELGDVREGIEVQIGNVPDVADLWKEGDVAIQPSKMEGIGFGILEPVCSGVPVITLDAAPMNEYAAELLVEPRWFKRKAFASQWVSQAHLRIPSQRGLARTIDLAANIDLEEISLRQRAWAEETFDPATLRAQWARAHSGTRLSKGIFV